MSEKGKIKKIDLEETAYRSNPSEESLTRVLTASVPMVRYFSSRLTGGRYSEDIIQAGYEGVLKAIKLFDPNRDIAFSTYVGHFIMGEIRHHLRKEAKFYKPRFIEGIQKQAQAWIEKYYQDNGQMPTQEMIARAVNVNEEGINEVMSAGLVSMDQLDLDKINSLHYESFKLPIEDRILLYQSIRKLSELKQKLIYCLFFKDYTQQQTADCLGLNQRKVSRLLKSSIGDLKSLMAD